MKNQPLKFLFVPVSSTEGIGEYMRSLIIASGVIQKWPDAQIEFVLNKHAPYAANCPFFTHLLNDTPTKKIKAVNELMSKFQPDMVIFDASGRRAQLQHAKNIGAKVVFISQHKRKRKRGMKLNRAKLTDCHWVVQPEFVLGRPNWLERFKLKLINKPEPTFIGPLFTQPNTESQQGLLDKFRLKKEEFLVFNAGSGGHTLGDKLAADIFAEAAVASYKSSGFTSVMVYGPNYPKPIIEREGIVAIHQLDNADFINLLAVAKAAVLSGGSTLLQAVAINRQTLGVPVSKDQPPRIKSCVDRELIISCDNSVEGILQGVTELLSPSNYERLAINMNQCPSFNGLEVSIQQIEILLGNKISGAQ